MSVNENSRPGIYIGIMQKVDDQKWHPTAVMVREPAMRDANHPAIETWALREGFADRMDAEVYCRTEMLENAKNMLGDSYLRTEYLTPVGNA